MSCLYDIGMIRPFLSKSELSELQMTEGVGKIYGAKIYHLYLDGKENFYYDTSLCIPYIDKRTLIDQHLKIWHKGRMVYQISKNDEVVFSIEEANNNINKYNILIVPLGYFMITIFILLLCLCCIKNKMR